jgi:tetratricopeptide (TPR) repeat protein
LSAQAERAEERGDYANAEQCWRQALLLMGDARTLTTVILLNKIGHVREVRRDYKEATDDYQKALEVNAHLPKPDAIEHASSLNNLGTIAMLQGQLAEAERLVREALRVLESAGFSESHSEVSILSNFGLILQKEQKFQAARETFERAERTLMQMGDQNTVKRAKLLVSEGRLSLELADYADATTKTREALEMERSLPGVRNIDKAVAENNLALALMPVHKYAEAEALLADSVALFRNEPAEPDLGIIEALTSLAVVEEKMDKLDIAEHTAEEALSYAVQLAGPESKQAANAHNEIACVKLHRKALRAARAEFEMALRLWTAVTGPNSWEYAATLTNLGSVEDRAGNHKQAQARYEAALRIDEAQLGPDSPKVANDLINVAAELYDRKMWLDALPLLKQAKDIREKKFGPASIQAANTWHLLAVVNRSGKNLDDAEAAYAQAVAAFKIAGPDEPEFFDCLREYAVVLRHLQRFNDAEQADLLATRIQVKSAIRSERDPMHPPVALSWR